LPLFGAATREARGGFTLRPLSPLKGLQGRAPPRRWKSARQRRPASRLVPQSA